MKCLFRTLRSAAASGFPAFIIAALAGCASAASAAAPTPTGSGAVTSSGGAAGSGNVQVALMQQQALQAVLVACIGETDLTVQRNGDNNNLKTICPVFVKAFGDAIPELLKPAVTGQGGGGTSTARKK